MSERRHPPSARRLEQARARGDVAVSEPLTAAAALLGATVGALALSGRGWSALVALARSAFGGGAELTAIAAAALRTLVLCAAPPLVGGVVGALVAGLVQTRGLFAPSRIGLAAPSRRPRDGAGRGLLFALATLLALALALGAEPALRSPAPLDGVASAIGRVALRVAGALLAIGGLDFLTRRAAWRRSHWMTRGEVERERREEEGDPRLRAERRRRHQALGGARIADEVARAAVVIVGGGAAAALYRDGDLLRAAAVGERLLGARIVEMARRLNVPVRSDEPLAPALAALRPGEAVRAPLAARAMAIADAAER